tara:strand:- start:560 stop:1033 length:474 start_codon:yes stop_codon:yes gene_type:complete
MFNVGREFNKIASTQGAGFFGALPQENQRQELRFAGNALRNATKMKSAKEGIAMAEAEGAANRRNSLLNTIIGGVGNIASSGISAYIGNRNYLNDRYGSPSMSPYDGPLPSTTAPSTGFDSTPGSQTWGPIQPLPPLPGPGGNAQGQNPYSINTTGW